VQRLFRRRVVPIIGEKLRARSRANRCRRVSLFRGRDDRACIPGAMKTLHSTGRHRARCVIASHRAPANTWSIHSPGRIYAGHIPSGPDGCEPQPSSSSRIQRQHASRLHKCTSPLFAIGPIVYRGGKRAVKSKSLSTAGTTNFNELGTGVCRLREIDWATAQAVPDAICRTFGPPFGSRLAYEPQESDKSRSPPRFPDSARNGLQFLKVARR